ncbi:flagellar hook-length control protein FliK [Shinella curvata]|uniref:Flagellar hook-length control protein FliK n=1 Tax=Shinella curvata TaxID=1817964 RepID=A0ABT8XBJ9_9HYPH|nr:flagellar hook-length control protein FliK [Shinella curvata]MCJ8054000.1 flagellar hook-length control protein FliK [Shinella curvata]MDO6121022.1 flagellar hook-length control protein FliK [Shinella curvata]
MSTIGNGINGVLQGQTSSKSKAAQGKATGTAQKGDFASTIANLQGRNGDGDGGRKGGRISIAATSQNQIQTEHAAGTHKTGQRDLAALAEALQEASAASPSKQDGARFAEGAGARTDDAGQRALPETKTDDPVADKAMVRDGDQPEAKPADTPRSVDKLLVALENAKGTRSENGSSVVSVDVKDAKDTKSAYQSADLVDTKETKDVRQDGADAPGKTDVGNLLEMLAAPAAMPQAVVIGAAAQVAASGATPDGKAPQGEKIAAKAEMLAAARGEGQAAAQSDATLPVETGDVSESDTDQLFRLIRADGKGRDLDMSISGTGERTSVRDANQATAAKVETVTVLESRRYIGLAQTGNAGAVTTAIAQDPNWAASLSATSGLSHSEAAVTGKVVNTLKIQMKPVDLGMVTATLRLHGDALVVSLQVDTAEAYRQLSDDQESIVKALRGHGFAVDQVSVQLSPVDRSSGQQQGDGQTQQQQQQFSSQPQAREGGNGRQGGNGDGTRTFAGEGTSHDGTTSENASGLAGGQPVRSGGVYL